MTKYNQISSVRTRKPRLRGDDKSWAVYKKSPSRRQMEGGRERQVPGIDRAWSRE